MLIGLFACAHRSLLWLCKWFLMPQRSRGASGSTVTFVTQPHFFEDAESAGPCVTNIIGPARKNREVCIGQRSYQIRQLDQ